MSINVLEYLVPRPHPLTRGNDPVNQVKFLGLAHTFATVSLTIYSKPTQKRYGCSSRDCRKGNAT